MMSAHQTFSHQDTSPQRSPFIRTQANKETSTQRPSPRKATNFTLKCSTFWKCWYPEIFCPWYCKSPENFHRLKTATHDMYDPIKNDWTPEKFTHDIFYPWKMLTPENFDTFTIFGTVFNRWKFRPLKSGHVFHSHTCKKNLILFGLCPFGGRSNRWLNKSTLHLYFCLFFRKKVVQNVQTLVGAFWTMTKTKQIFFVDFLNIKKPCTSAWLLTNQFHQTIYVFFFGLISKVWIYIWPNSRREVSFNITYRNNPLDSGSASLPFNQLGP